MHGTPPTTWRRFVFPSGRRISARFESGVRGEGNFYVPSLSVDVEDDRYVITARIPGAERDELHVSLQGNVLRITGERQETRHSERGGTRRDTRYLSRFMREVCLTREVAADEIEAHFDNGVLTVRLPFLHAKRQEEAEATLIDIH